MRVLVIGSGGRESALVWKLSQSPGVENVWVAPGNGGTPGRLSDVPVDDFPALRKFCEENKVALVVVGPEKQLVAGIVDAFQGSSVRVLGPDRQGALLEGSKCFAKEFMRRHGVCTGRATSVLTVGAARDVIGELNGWLVLKFDGLASGKGVVVCSSVDEAEAGLAKLIEEHRSPKISDKSMLGFKLLIEERLEGWEVSIIGFTDGKDIALLPPAQDHKQLLDGDKGPNTGGMGAFTPVEACDASLLSEIRRTIIEPTLRGIAAEKMTYRGPIYFGVMVTPTGPKLLEYNVRLGDPEAQVLLPAMKTDLLDVIEACFNGKIGGIPLEFHEGSRVGVVLATGDYPQSGCNGLKIDGLEKLARRGSDVLVFHGATRLEEGKILTAGGRIVTVVAKGATLSDARNCVYEAISQVSFSGMRYRKDIGDRHT
ncbi:MAG: phosphoribosylamine--glycine ligase [Candidatus Ozemobacteraceae bacterium]